MLPSGTTAGEDDAPTIRESAWTLPETAVTQRESRVAPEGGIAPVGEPVPAGAVHVIVPDAIDDPARPSGGNRYDRRICSGLADAGWQVHEHVVPDTWPKAGHIGVRTAERMLTGLPDGALVLVDGLIASTAAPVFAAQAGRLTLVVLVHMPPDADPPTQQAAATALAAARAVITTSAWTRDRLLADYPLAEDAVHVAEPGVDPAPAAMGSADGTRLLCVGPVAWHKGHDIVLAALIALATHPWRCAWVGPLDRDPAFVTRLRQTIEAVGFADRINLRGPLAGAELDEAYRSADLLVHASRGEAYGMVVTEALARGVPVIATAAGGLPDALGQAPDGTRPGLLVPLDDAVALAAALRDWLTDPDLRRRFRESALARRRTLPGWSRTTERVARVLATAAS